MASKNRGNHNNYRGPLLAKINLSQVTVIDAPHFAVIDQSEYLLWGTDYGCPITGPHRPRELTIKTTLPHHQVQYPPFLFRRLSGLTVSFGFKESKFLKSLPEPGLAVNLRRLSLLGVCWPLTELVEQLVVPLTTTTKVEKGVITINDRLEELRVAWKFQSSPTDSLTSVVRFTGLTTLHLVRSTLLHR